MLTLKHIANTLETAAPTSCIDGTATTSSRVVDQTINGLLQHALLIVLNHLWCIELDELLEAVIAVDDAAVEVVEVARCKAPTTQGYHWSQVWWDDRQNRHAQA